MTRQAAYHLSKYSSRTNEASSTTIAKSCGVSQSMTHYYFGSINALYSEGMDWLEVNDPEAYKKVVARELADEASFIHEYLANKDEDALPW